MNRFIKYFWNFIIGSFIGYILETIWCFIRFKKIESRKGLIYFPLIPIYGIATLLLTIIIELLNINNSFIYFILTFIICSIVEYISSIIQEKCFNTKSWDYTNMIGNINGRINILYLSGWSLIGVVWCNIYKVIFNVIVKIPLLEEITIILFILVLYDCFISIVASYRQRKRRENIKANNKFEEWLDKIYNDKRLEKIFANAKYIR